MNDKFELIGGNIRGGYYRVRALKSFSDVKEGDVGGYVESEYNLSSNGDCWIYNNAMVYGHAEICDNAKVYNKAMVYGYARVFDDAKVYDKACIWDYAKIGDKAEIYGDAEVYEYSSIYGNAKIYGRASVFGNANITRGAEISSSFDYFVVKGLGRCCRTTTFYKGNNDIFVSCGCFNGNINEFKKEVLETHGGNTKFGIEYLKIAELAEYCFEKG